MGSAPRLQVVVYEGAGSRPWDPPVRNAVLALLLQRGYTVRRVARISRHHLPAGSDAIAVLGRFDGVQPAVAEAAEGGRPIFFEEVDGLSPDDVMARVDGMHAKTGTSPRAAWKPWFPVIDYSRCTNCMQCLTFCLFDVYGVSREKQIEVRNPTNCKTDCPACSRVCPEVAILFPKYKGGPINGDEVREADIHREKMKVDISALLGGDIYAALRQRSVEAKTRFSRERDEKRALDERRKCLTKLQQDLGIPPEVLAALPSMDQIQARTARAVAESEGPE
jgi:Pyruvate/2-oxoacid:ferredoxin oxidoreductase delta subunit